MMRSWDGSWPLITWMVSLRVLFQGVRLLVIGASDLSIWRTMSMIISDLVLFFFGERKMSCLTFFMEVFWQYCSFHFWWTIDTLIWENSVSPLFNQVVFFDSWNSCRGILSSLCNSPISSGQEYFSWFSCWKLLSSDTSCFNCFIVAKLCEAVCQHSC